MGKRLAILALIACLFATSTVRAEINSQDVKESIERGVQFLKKQQLPTGGWTEYPGHPGGLTALCTLALLNCGEPAEDPTVRRALQYLEGLPKPDTTYSAALRIMVFAAADPRRYKQKIAEMATWLEGVQITTGAAKGSWSYGHGAGNRGDGSNTQFAMLGLHDAEKAGAKVADQTWQLALNYWLSAGIQHPDGPFVYDQGADITGSMTCAGVASLIMAFDRLQPGDASVREGFLSCCGNQPTSKEVEMGLDWLGRKFTVHTNPNVKGLQGVGRSYPHLLYYLYGIERVGRMSGRRFLGAHDWFREGAEFLVQEQRRSLNGSWTGTGVPEANPLVGTSLALLFLSKGRRPVVISKLRHTVDQGSPHDWDLHRHGIAHLTSYVETLWRKDLTWQTIDIRQASVSDLMETPVLFISGSEGLKMARDQKQNLKEYIEQGGFVLAEACDGNNCNGEQFDREFRALMTELFPESQLRKLPPDHAVWYAQETVDPQSLPTDPNFWLWGLDTCCRTGVVYCPRSLSCYWEVAHPYRTSNIDARLQQQVDAVVKIGGNILAYATNRELKEKLDRPQTNLSDVGGKAPRGSLTIPKLSHSGGSDDAPNALANLLKVLEIKMEMRTDPQRRMIAPSDPKLLDFPLVFAHGRRAFRFSAAERKGLETYLTRGGFLFADAICASEPFADSLRSELKAIFPNAQFIRVPADHALFSDELGGFDLRTVMLRDPKLRIGNDPLAARVTETAPLLEALEIEGRIAVVLSPYDISCALERGASMECKGYKPIDAAKIGINVVLYALQQ